MKLRVHPAAQILELEWRVSELLRAVEEGHPWKPAERAAVRVLVWRRNARVFYRDLERAEAAALEAASRGARFAEICDVAATEADDDDPVAAMNRMLTRWLSDGLLAHG